MEIIAKSNFIRQTPRKLRLVADQIRGLNAQEAMMVLENLNKRAAQPLLLTLKQGIGNAVNNFGLDPVNLKIKKLEIGKGPIYKRWRFASRGRVHQVQKKTSHIRMVLEGEKGRAGSQQEKKIGKKRNKKTKKGKAPKSA